MRGGKPGADEPAVDDGLGEILRGEVGGHALEPRRRGPGTRSMLLSKARRGGGGSGGHSLSQGWGNRTGFAESPGRSQKSRNNLKI